MEKTHKAIAKVASVHGAYVLCRKDVFCAFLDDMIPEQIEERQFIRTIYNDEIGTILSEASRAPFCDKDSYYSEIDVYLQNECGLMEPIRRRFIDIFKDSFKRKTVEVKKYKDYKPALYMLKQKFGSQVSDELIQDFVEENRLFFRFSLTIDDVKEDLKLV